MSKKKTKKFRAGIKSAVKSTPVVGAYSCSLEQIETATETTGEIVETKADREHAENEKQYSFVRKDVKKLGMTFSILVLLFIGCYVLSTQTSILTNLGNWLYKIGNFQI